MAEASLVTQINDWLVDQSLGEPDIVDLFDGVCQRLSGIGIPIARGAADVVDAAPAVPGGDGAVAARPAGRAASSSSTRTTNRRAWQRSPMRFMLDAGVPVLRRRLDRPRRSCSISRSSRSSPKQGYTDYLIVSTELFAELHSSPSGARRGMFVTWASDRPGGFTDDDLAALQRIQRRLAIACKTVIQTRIARNITEAYLGRQTGDRVLNGSIRLGDGEQTRRSSGSPTSGTRRASPRRCRARISSTC